MAQYSFKISNGELSYATTELSDDDAAWHEAVQTVRDIEATLHPGGTWTVVVTREGEPLFRIDVRAQKLG